MRGHASESWWDHVLVHLHSSQIQQLALSRVCQELSLLKVTILARWANTATQPCILLIRSKLIAHSGYGSRLMSLLDGNSSGQGFRVQGRIDPTCCILNRVADPPFSIFPFAA